MKNKAIQNILMFIIMYYGLTTLAWFPWGVKGVINWTDFVSSEMSYFVGGIVSIFCTLVWRIEKDYE